MKTAAYAALAAALSVMSASAQVPSLVGVQGRVAVNNVNFDGVGTFRFAIVNSAGNTTYWSNDLSSTIGDEPAAGVPLTVTNGHYSLNLGDTGLTGMKSLPASVFDNANVFVRIWFDDGVNGSELLTPDRQIVASGYSVLSKTVEDGGITTDKIGAGAVTGAKIGNAAITGSNIAGTTISGANIINNTITGTQLADSGDFGSTAASGNVYVWDGGEDQATVRLDGVSSAITTYGSDGLLQTRLYGQSWGVLQLWDFNTENNQTVELSSGLSGTSDAYLSLRDPIRELTRLVAEDSLGGQLILNQLDGQLGVDMRGNSSGGGFATFYQADGLRAVEIDGVGNDVTIFQDDDDSAVALNGGASGSITFYDTDGTPGGFLSGSGNSLTLYADDGSSCVYMTGESSAAGLIQVRNSTSGTRISLDGEDTTGGGKVTVYDASGTSTIELFGAESSTFGGRIEVNDANGAERIRIEANEGSTDGSQIALYNDSGTQTLVLDAEFNDGGASRVTTGTVQITGGSDLSEQFAVNHSEAEMKPEPGMLVSIDPDDPGALKPSSVPYDRKVAGIISGAGGINPGMLMGQAGTLADGEHPIALTGRVYCMVDASNGPIQPGDLITTSFTPGHGMKVTDHTLAQGAIIGKAMTSLSEGAGLVLVLVSLQ